MPIDKYKIASYCRINPKDLHFTNNYYVVEKNNDI